jgi:integrase
MLRDHILHFFGRRRLDEIGMADIEAFKAQMKKKTSRSRQRKEAPTKWALAKRKGGPPSILKPKSINNALTVLRKLLAVAQEQGVIAHLPRVKLFHAASAPFEFLDFDEANRLVAAADPAWRPLILTALLSGLRSGELIGLQWTDLDLVRGKLHVRRTVWRGVTGLPKGGRIRVVDLPRSLVAAIAAYRHLKGPFVFCEPDGKRLSPGKLKRPLERALLRSGISRPDGHIGWHDLRHTYGSHLAMRGVPLKVIQELMGHASLEMTMRYAHLSPETKQVAVQCLDDDAPSAPAGAHVGHMAMWDNSTSRN